MQAPQPTPVSYTHLGVLGVSACGGDEWEYYIAVATKKEAPAGLSEYTVPAGTWAVFPGTGAMPHAIQELEKRVVTEWLPSSGYEYADRPDMEVYLKPDPAKARFEVWAVSYTHLDVYKRQVRRLRQPLRRPRLPRGRGASPA